MGMYLSLSTGQRDVDESSGVLQTLLGAALGDLLLLHRFDLFRDSDVSYHSAQFFFIHG